MPESKSPTRKRILFVCLGNICRSPAAEGVLRHLAEERGVGQLLEIDSAGTGAWHTGKPPDARMRTAAGKRGISLASRARQVHTSDFSTFDLIVAMDDEVRNDLLGWTGAPPHKTKVRLFGEFLPPGSRYPSEVPDPYYGKDEGFDYVLDMVQEGCTAILDSLFKDVPSSNP